MTDEPTVTDTPTPTKPCVLHLAASQTPALSLTPSDVDHWLADLGAQVEHYADVYRALAVILRAQPGCFQGAVVCLEAMTPAEMEFFSLVSRLRRQLPIYVYSSTGNGDRWIGDAVGRGAAGVVSQDALRALIGSPPRTDDRTAVIAQQPDSRQFPAVEQAAEAQEVESADEDADPLRTARVPWLRYTDRPERTAPPRGRPQSAGANTREAAPPSDVYEPLLTQAELDALMGDDISTIASDEAIAWRPARDVPRGGS